MFDYIDLMSKLTIQNEKKIVMLVMDGLGGMEREPGGKTELESAKTPNMDALAADGVCGLLDPIAPGITPGSGPGHLSLFGYDPVRYEIGRGVLAASGIGIHLNKSDVAARGNFCTMDSDGNISDRRAGRIPTEKTAELCQILSGIEIDGVTAIATPVRDYRCSVVFRGEGLSGNVADTDSQQTGKPPLPAVALDKASEKTAHIANKFLEVVKERLKGLHPANFMLMRGFDSFPDMPAFRDFTKLSPASVAVYPDYKGITRIIGMDVIDFQGEAVRDEVEAFKTVYKNHDFFYFHVKKTDSYGEDGNFDGKVHVIEETDAIIPDIMALKPDVLIITGDHSTPAVLKSHSWHPLPVLIHSDVCRRDHVKTFGENACVGGGLGRLPTVSLMPIALSNAGKMLKFGA